MSVRVLRAGLLTTIQDLGRSGWQQSGVVGGGAMDTVALRIANLLVSNEPGAAALEMTLLGPTLHFQRDTLIAITGGDFSPRVAGEMVPMQRPVMLPAGTPLTFDAARRGCRAYLAVAGGFDVPIVLGSRSTYLRARIGGLEGRPLRAGDELPSGIPSLWAARLSNKLAVQRGSSLLASVRWRAGIEPMPSLRTIVRVLRGPEFAALTPDSQNRLFTGEFTVSPQSDRMGYRLTGPRLELAVPGEILSSAVYPGTLQLPPEGQLILLMADCATLGGYPRIAHVASVDLPLAAQLKPGDICRLDEISLEQAHNLDRQQEAAIRCLTTSIKLKVAG